jgi:ComF family protein
MKFFSSLLSLIFPLECKICKRNLEAGNLTYICGECFNRITFLQRPYCHKCGKPFTISGYPPARLCRECRTGGAYFDRIYALGRYKGVLREAILLLKYKRVRALIDPLGELLVKYCQRSLKMDDFDVIFPVPLFRARKQEREFNQTEVLARIIGKHFLLPVSVGNLLRIRDTKGMNALGPPERKKNVKDAFKVKRKTELRERNILLLDDICTTGATVDECSRLLLEAGAKGVSALILARAG